MKATSGYPVLDNRPIDQWKVTDLKEELKRRKLITRGLKEELIKRLDEDIRKEMEAEKKEVDGNGVEEVMADLTGYAAKTVETTGFETGGLGLGLGLGNSENVEGNVVDAVKIVEITGFETSGLGLGLGLGNSENVEGNVVDAVKIVETSGFETSGSGLVNSEVVKGNVGNAGDGIVKLDDDVSGHVEIKDNNDQPVEGIDIEEKPLDLGSDQVSVEGTFAVDHIPANDLGNDSETLSSPKAGDGERLYHGKMGINDEGLKAEELSEDVKLLHEEGKLDSFDSNNQVSEFSSSLGFPIKSNSVSTEYVSFNEKNELKDNIITDNVNLEFDVKPEMVQPSSSDFVPDGGESHPSDVEEPHQNKVSTDNNVTNVDVSQKNYSADLVSEKLKLDRSSGDDSMEEDALETKHIDSSEEVVEKTDKNEVAITKGEIPVATMDIDIPIKEKGTHQEKSTLADASTDKRKLSDQEAVLNNEPTKRQRRWKSESNDSKEPQISNIPTQFVVKDVPQPAVLKRNLSGSKSSGVADEPPKEREVPPSLKPATNSLRIDRFLRPFTLKAVQELLAKTGTVTNFWMDHIKTHCYITYTSVEEAVETRNAVYNLQWPPNGGRNLVAEFVDPEEVKARLEPPPPPPAAPASSGPVVPEPTAIPQPSPRLQNLKQRMGQQPTLPPPPPLTNPPQAREQVLLPPPPQFEKVEAPIVTLDDLFKKTKATPRIYYLPLSEEQVEARRRNSTQQ